MQIEKNIIFIYPLSEELEELKMLVESEDEYMVYDLESIPEYGQLIGIMDYSITFSTDFKKTEEYVNQCSDFIKTPKAKNFLISEKTVPVHIAGKLKNLGLNDIITEKLTSDDLAKMVTNFFGLFDGSVGIEGNAIAEEEVEEKKSVDFSSVDKKIESKGLDQDHQKVTSMGDYDFSSGMFSNFKLRKNTSGLPLIQSNFDNLQRKKVKTFKPFADSFDFKGVSFNPIAASLSKNGFKNLEIKKGAELNLPGRDPKRKKVNFKEIDKQIGTKKSAEFKEVEKPSSDPKKGNFKEVERNLNKKETPKFEEQKKDYDRKKAMFDVVQKDLAKKRQIFEEVEREIKKKRNTFEELEKESPARKKFEEIQRDLKKKQAEFEEAEREFNKNKKLFEEVEPESPERKKAEFGLIEAVKKNRGVFEEVQRKGPLWKKALEDVAKENNLNNVEFPEFETPPKERKKFEEVEIDWNSKIGENSLDDEKNKKKHGTFEEVKRDKEFKQINIDESEKEKEEIKPLTLSDKALNIFQTLDYSEFKEKRKTGTLDLDEDDEVLLIKKIYEEDIQEEDLNFYRPQNLGLEYLILYEDLLLKDGIQIEHLGKMIQFALLKEFNAPLSVYLVANKTESFLDLLPVFEGHTQQNDFFDKDSYAEFLKKEQSFLAQANIPTFKDDTFQLIDNYFVYPFYEDSELKAIGICHVGKHVSSHALAKKVELIIMSLKGFILDEYKAFKGGS